MFISNIDTRHCVTKWLFNFAISSLQFIQNDDDLQFNDSLRPTFVFIFFLSSLLSSVVMLLVSVSGILYRHEVVFTIYEFDQLASYIFASQHTILCWRENKHFVIAMSESSFLLSTFTEHLITYFHLFILRNFFQFQQNYKNVPERSHLDILFSCVGKLASRINMFAFPRLHSNGKTRS